jgi:hypothetical protein
MEKYFSICIFLLVISNRWHNEKHPRVITVFIYAKLPNKFTMPISCYFQLSIKCFVFSCKDNFSKKYLLWSHSMSTIFSDGLRNLNNLLTRIYEKYTCRSWISEPTNFRMLFLEKNVTSINASKKTGIPFQDNCLKNIKPLNTELNPICHLLALLGGAIIVVVSRLRVNKTFINLLILIY